MDSESCHTLMPPLLVDQNKLRTLALRFTEGPTFPSSLISGPSAFPRIRLEHEAISAAESTQPSNQLTSTSESEWGNLRESTCTDMASVERVSLSSIACTHCTQNFTRIKFSSSTNYSSNETSCKSPKQICSSSEF